MTQIMTAERSFFENLLRRRVLQIAGMYVAATWVVIELGDWVTERFNLPPNLTSYVFVAMLVLLPAVVLFAYNHGAPGKDKWTGTGKGRNPAECHPCRRRSVFHKPSVECGGGDGDRSDP